MNPMKVVRLLLGTVALALLALSVNLGGWPLTVIAVVLAVIAVMPRLVWTIRRGRPNHTTSPESEADDAPAS